jgi:hypothetical protein
MGESPEAQAEALAAVVEHLPGDKPKMAAGLVRGRRGRGCGGGEGLGRRGSGGGGEELGGGGHEEGEGLGEGVGGKGVWDRGRG